MNVLFSSQLPQELWVTDSGMSLRLVIFALGMKEEKEAAAFKQNLRNVRDPSGLCSPGIPVLRFPQQGSAAQGSWLCLPPRL